MDVFVTRQKERFVWDSDKDVSNYKKHGVSFERALEVFSDPYLVLFDASVSGDQRFGAIGQDVEHNCWWSSILRCLRTW